MMLRVLGKAFCYMFNQKLFFFLAFGYNFFHILFKLYSGQHNHMATAAALNTKINAYTKNFPLAGAAGVGLLHLHNISN
jgi:hypothetical protein